MSGGRERVLTAYQRVLTGELRFIFPRPLVRRLMRRLGVQQGLAAQYYVQAHAHANRGEYDKAIGACRASIAVWPDNTAAYEVLAQVHAHVRQYDEALEACASGLARNPNSDALSASLNQLLPLVRESAHPESVIATLQRCLAGGTPRGNVLTVLIDMLLRSRRYVEAVQACQRMLEIDPESFPAANTIRTLLDDPAARPALAKIGVSAPPVLSDEYDWLVAANVTGTLLAVMSKFYSRLGVDPQTAPLVQGLERARRKLAQAQPHIGKLPAQSTLVLFERGWRQYSAGQTEKARTAFETIVNDGAARERASHNPLLKEAIVRSGEIVGRYYDTRGDAEMAISIYRDVLSVDPDSIVARRLIVLLSRRGRLAEAAQFAETAIVSRPNLSRPIPPNQHMSALKAELFLNAEGA
jgi:tetratricopeptide (TPR) repeat protein